MSEPERLSVSANGVMLNVYRFGPEQSEATPPVIMLHGMRDVGLSLLPIALELAEERRIYLADLRGHGLSDCPGAYAMPNSVYDLHCLVSELVGAPTVLFGHSLGGQIVARFAALYPDLCTAAIIGRGGPGDNAQHSGEVPSQESDRLATSARYC